MLGFNWLFQRVGKVELPKERAYIWRHDKDGSDMAEADTAPCARSFYLRAYATKQVVSSSELPEARRDPVSICVLRTGERLDLERKGHEKARLTEVGAMWADRNGREVY